MTRRKSRWLGVSLLASAGVGLLEVASMLNPAVAPADDTALIMGFAGNSDPPQSYVNEVMSLFINPTSQQFPGQPTFPGYSPLVQSTPEGLDYQQVIPQGTAELDQGISEQLAHGNVVVFGYSESTSIATQEMIDLGNLPADQRPDPADLQFRTCRGSQQPQRRVPRAVPVLCYRKLSGHSARTLPTTRTFTRSSTAEAPDFPQYPTNLLADANAVAGFVDLHPFLLPDWPTGFTRRSSREPCSSRRLGHAGNTEYYLIPTQNLPLLDGLRASRSSATQWPTLMQPDMRVIIDLGYDRAGDADVVTPADWQCRLSIGPPSHAELAAGAQQG